MDNTYLKNNNLGFVKLGGRIYAIVRAEPRSIALTGININAYLNLNVSLSAMPTVASIAEAIGGVVAAQEEINAAFPTSQVAAPEAVEPEADTAESE